MISLHQANVMLLCIVLGIFTLTLTPIVVTGRLLYTIYAMIADHFRSREILSRSCPNRIRNMHECEQLLRHSSLESRAGPNQRLVVAFGIDNAFTTTDSAYQKRFVGKTKALMLASPEGWTNIALVAKDILQTALPTLTANNKEAPFSLVKLVQGLVFRVVVVKFFPDANWPSAEDTEYITTTINSQWLASKCLPRKDPVALARDRKKLLRKLQTLVQVGTGEDRNSGRENPLNIILPAYETLWRIVLSCFLEVRFRSSPEDLVKYSRMFDVFLANVNPATFKTPHHETLLSVRNVVDEALRLYPPTRRIYRQHDGGVVAVDVEDLHRQPEAWGVYALEFLPSRWTWPSTKKSPYIPFGMTKFECPAKNSFGPMMIGILVGGLVQNIGEDFELVMDGSQEEGLGPGPLESGREAHVGLLLKRSL